MRKDKTQVKVMKKEAPSSKTNLNSEKRIKNYLKCFVKCKNEYINK